MIHEGPCQISMLKTLNHVSELAGLKRTGHLYEFVYTEYCLLASKAANHEIL